ncbi:RidA family protein [Natronospira bacteriovora]|uniref:RidA family protein n=1 Tax=Natronospira bacteriovora TaxID=3069753 RepID=A0ABU0W851_9GAMM|nr:RidA family protein [Natronospira sp. AB-CW4]MDQ2070189.1 RidA family protein [Natronospira sp. AB-CW4]
MSREVIHSKDAPEAIGPYSQAIRVGNTVYLSGQIPLDPASGELVTGDIDTQVRRVFDNLTAVCEAAGGSLAHIVKLQIYLTDLSHFATVNQIMQAYFQSPYPARAALGVAQLPKGAEVEMDGVMVVDG